MKTALFILAYLLYSVFSYSQETDVFPDSNAVWHMQESECCPIYVLNEYNIVTKRDTVIHGNTYLIIGNENTKNDYAIREDTNKKVWVIYIDRLLSYNPQGHSAFGQDSIYDDTNQQWIYYLGDDTTEYLLYDFNVQPGDSVSIYFPPFNRNTEFYLPKWLKFLVNPFYTT